MRKFIFLLLSVFFVFLPIFALSKDELIGKWRNGKIVLSFTADSLFWDEFKDKGLTELIEGSACTYTISNDTLIYRDTLMCDTLQLQIIKDRLKITLDDNKIYSYKRIP